MAKPTTKEAPRAPQPSESRTARRRREKRAKKKALSSSSNPANSAPPAQALAPKPVITKPQIAKPSISYGLQVSDLILHDTIQLYSTAAPTPIKEDNKLCIQEKLAILGKLVLHQAKLPQRQLHAMNEVPAIKPVKRREPAPTYKSQYNASNTFAFAKLPPELRVMIEVYVFTESSGRKPKMLWATKGNKELYAEAKEVWCKVNEFWVTYRESALNKVREEMEGVERKLVKRALVNVSKDVQACTIFSPTILLFPNLTHLTLRVHTTSGFSLSIHHIIPKLSHLQQVTVQIQGSKRLTQSHIPVDNTEFFRSFLKIRIMLDNMLDRPGKCVHVGQKLHEWVWKVDGKDEVFRPRCRKLHIKFDEDAEDFAVSNG